MFYYQLKSTKNMDIRNELFKNYPDPTYLVKIRKLNRPLIEVRFKLSNELAAIAVLNKFGRHLKLCLIIVHKEYKNRNLGNSIIKVIKDMFLNDFNDVDILYTVCPHQFNTDTYQKLLIKNGFQVTTIKANGDIVYTYAKSI